MSTPSKEHAIFYGPQKPKPVKMGMGTPGPNENPLADQDERAKELGIELEPGPGPVVLADGSVYQAPRYVITPPIVNPGPPNRSAASQLAARLAKAEAQVKRCEEELATATKALDDARAARARDPGEASTRADLERCLSAVALATEDHAACAAGRDQIAASIKAKAQMIQEYDAADLASRPEALHAAMTPLRAEAEELGRRLAELSMAIEPHVTTALRALSRAEYLADELEINHYDRGTNSQTAAIHLALAFQKGWREGGGVGPFRRFTGG